MRSTASIKSHPVHPILVAFPIAFFVGTLLFDTLGFIFGRPDFSGTASYLNIAGVIAALLAAIPGVVDYFFTVPPKSSGKKRATTHGILNVTNVIIFFIAWKLRTDISSSALIVIEVAGIIILSIAGWLGGTLVYRNQIGVDPRYANAGKWKEEHIKHSRGDIQVATVDELQTNQMKLIHVDGKRIVIGKTENGYVAFNDHCTHKGGSLAGGAMICGTVQCPWHGSQFDVRTGNVRNGPAKEGIMCYDLKEENGKVLLAASALRG
ncbi:MAG TPA: DUF2231 domain-containing protein [Parafilimonas sp.]|nr:DUF2231 domain-containing protein [Parafilimonas sp.]